MGKNLVNLPPGVDFAQHPGAFPRSFGFTGSAPVAPGPMPPPTPMGGPMPPPTPGGVPIPPPTPGGALTPPPTPMPRPPIPVATPMSGPGPVAGGMNQPVIGPPRPMSRGGRYAKGGAVTSDDAEDKKMVAKGVHQHEANLHKGQKETKLKLRRGGAINGGKTRIPRRMLPKPATDHSAFDAGRQPMNRPPKNPMKTRTEPNVMPGGVMAYGVQPGDQSTSPPSIAKATRVRR